MTAVSRVTRDQLGLLLATAWSLRGTCARRRVGCVLIDADGRPVGSGYNGPASGLPHCTDAPCPGVGLKSGVGLSVCEAIHAEINALTYCPDPRLVHTVYVTASPCIDCVKVLMNTSAKRIVFVEPYAHDAPARDMWIKSGQRRVPERSWEQGEALKILTPDVVEAMFAQMRHGDTHHEAWLHEAFQRFASGQPAPPAYGGTSKEKRIKELEGLLVKILSRSGPPGVDIRVSSELELEIRQALG